MRIQAECVPCLLERVRHEALISDPDRAVEALMAAAREIGDSRPVEVSAEVASRAHRAAYQALGTRDPYAESKALSNEVGLRLLPRARELYQRAPMEDRLRTAALLSIVGNVLDFGIEGGLERPDELEEAFDRLVGQGLDRDDSDRMERLLGPGVQVAYLADNCGEIVLDRLLIEELGARGCHVALVVKGDPVLTDATAEDAEELGLSEVVDRVVDTGPMAVGVDLRSVPQGTRDVILGADLVVSKGMANYESLSDTDIGPIAYLLRTKCDPVASSIGEAKDINVLKLFL